MNILRLPVLTTVFILYFLPGAEAQLIADNNTYTSVRTSNKDKTNVPSSYRYSRKLPQLFSGYAIEIAYSDYPLDRTNPIFRQFGNIVYEKLKEGGYSYLILSRFSTRESAIHFMQTAMLPRVSEARLFQYQEGIRTVIRE